MARYYDELTAVYTVAGFFKEWESFQLYGEYYFYWKNSGEISHNAALAGKWDNPFGAPFNLGFSWMHYFADNSGTVTCGLSQGIWPNVSMKLGLPIVYGPDNSIAVSGNSRKLSFVFALTLSGGF